MAEVIDLFTREKLKINKEEAAENKPEEEPQVEEIIPGGKKIIKEMIGQVGADSSQGAFLNKLMDKMDKLDKDGKSLFTRINMIESLNSSPTSDVIQDKYVADLDDKEEVLSRIMDSTESDWKRRAAYYKALVRRYRILAFSGK